MTTEIRHRVRISRRLVGEPIRSGLRTIWPVARMSGWQASVAQRFGGIAGAWLRVRPAEAIVLEGDGREYHISLRPRHDPVRLMQYAGLSVWLVSWLVRRRAAR